MKKPTFEDRLHVRNYPPDAPVMKQNWRNLLFLHWKYNKDALQKMLPPGLYVDTFNDEA